MFVDEVAEKLKVDRAVVLPIPTGEGFERLAERVKEKKIDLSEFKVIVLMLGRADFRVSDFVFETNLRKSIVTIRECNSSAFIVLCATLPVPGDNFHDINTSKHRSGVLARMANDNELLEFLKPGKKLVKRPGGAMREFFEKGKLNEDGLQQVKRGIEAKLVVLVY